MNELLDKHEAEVMELLEKAQCGETITKINRESYSIMYISVTDVEHKRNYTRKITQRKIYSQMYVQ